MKEITKEEGQILIEKWLSEDRDLKINERIYVIEKILRNLITEPD
jgi:hypothetical protein